MYCAWRSAREHSGSRLEEDQVLYAGEHRSGTPFDARTGNAYNFVLAALPCNISDAVFGSFVHGASKRALRPWNSAADDRFPVADVRSPRSRSCTDGRYREPPHSLGTEPVSL